MCIDVQSENCISRPPFGSLSSGTIDLLANHAKSSTTMAVTRLAAPINAAFTRLCRPSSLNYMSSHSAAKLMRTKMKSIGKR